MLLISLFLFFVGDEGPELSDKAIPLQTESMPERPKLLLDLGNPFNGQGVISQGFVLPTGAVWQPSFQLFGSLRLAYQHVDDVQEQTEFVARLDLTGNLQLSGSERIVVGFRNLDKNGQFSGVVFDSASGDEGSVDQWNADVTNLFFEGDFGEIFPRLSLSDSADTDIGFAVGRQAITFQDGLLINDVVDGFGVTINTLQPGSASNVRATLFWAWDRLAANSDLSDRNHLIGLFTSSDIGKVTMDIDIAYVEDRFQNLHHWASGFSFVQRISHWNSSLNLMMSDGDQDDFGYLIAHQASKHTGHSRNLLYVNAFLAETYRPASIEAGLGGTLGRMGLAFAGPNIGSLGAPLRNDTLGNTGFVVGHQWLFPQIRGQFTLEMASQFGTKSSVPNEIAAVARAQKAAGRRGVWIADVFWANHEEDASTFWGGRVEFQLLF